jgi:RNA polymerase sigma-70 factor (ECF subfamily)
MMTMKLSQGEAARLLTQYHSALYSYIFACVRSHHDTEDILQNVSVVVMEALEDLRDESGFLPWSREIARRCALAYCRKGQRERALDPDLVRALAEAADMLEQFEPSSPQGEALLACLDGLPPRSRRLMILRYASSFVDTQELARRMNQSVQSIYAQVKRIKTALRNCVKRRLASETKP